MVTIRRENIIITPKIEESYDYSEIFDIARFFVPAEIYISKREIGW